MLWNFLNIKHYLGALFFMLIVTSCKGQTQTNVERNVDGGCQDCKALLDYKMLNINPKSVDTLPDFHENEPKLKITGTAFKKDGKTLAKDVILYIYHTNRNGIYQPSDKPVGSEKRHGQHRNWLKTGNDGKFTFLYIQTSVLSKLSRTRAHSYLCKRVQYRTLLYLQLSV
ncbi:hypothetical protein [Tenacibaculum mesophilum]|uniref:hypothetical protein n=1 Tax=Tenacibaculum mesophilum TaxID=104268 RepID=UPI000B24085A|nr:hypothetical protein [Tenacibaculum mesophilum]